MKGLCAVDHHRCYRRAKSKRRGIDNSSSFSSKIEGNHETADRKFSGMMCTSLVDEKRKQHGQRKIRSSLHYCAEIEMKLEIIKKYCSKERPPADK